MKTDTMGHNGVTLYHSSTHKLFCTSWHFRCRLAGGRTRWPPVHWAVRAGPCRGSWVEIKHCGMTGRMSPAVCRTWFSDIARSEWPGPEWWDWPIASPEQWEYTISTDALISLRHICMKMYSSLFRKTGYPTVFLHHCDLNACDLFYNL